ncbi:penicillin-binding protein 1C [Flammeovirgaceae bacterium SG7u.111]|nr:penicillin-binding protein 1C [Flammeovirgaceae bacterium SG7u.132]WPO37458.1 penicillin-binding protein 1C [Flammeovirgaceae bacterium SG7u.111]
MGLKLNKKVGVLIFMAAFVGWFFCLPSQLFDDPYATILLDKDDNLLGAMIAEDGQWRFPASDSTPHKFSEAIRYFEDQYFYQHPGFNPVSFFKAMVQNVKKGHVVRGGSTITMQVIRLSRKGQPRTFFEKFIELGMATRLELKYSKKEILGLYASHAPFGGNIVGLEAAAWRYYGRKPSELSWAEAALLAVLPNRPGLIFPGRNQETLHKKRDRLLKKLFEEKVLDSLGYQLALSEPLPGTPFPLPQLAPHLLTRCINSGLKGQKIHTTIGVEKQREVNEIVKRYYGFLKNNGVHNMAILVMDVDKGNTLAYVGNTQIEGNDGHGDDVDVITAPRSSGSILKPLLYGLMLKEGEILPNTLVPDVPTFIAGFAPQNFSKTYDGAISAKVALARSLNIPHVHMLRDYSIEKLHFNLQKMGMTTLHHHAEHYGLSLILGGAETTLWDISGIYSSMARILKNFHENSPYHYRPNEWRKPRFLKKEKVEKPSETVPDALLDASSIWYAFEAMQDVYRPGREESWELYETSRRVAWKTGTSFGHRDAWAIGVTPDYLVGVWVGNADGEGRPGLTGVTAAAPVLFDVFGTLPPTEWFEPPYDEMTTTSICRQSGHKASEICPVVDEMDIPFAGLSTEVCPYHQLVHLDASGQFRVNSDCEEVANMKHEPFFLLPPMQAWYYRTKHATYRRLPPIRSDCLNSSATVAKQVMHVVYPIEGGKIVIPRLLDGEKGEAVFQVAHIKPDSQVYWHLDGQYIGQTQGNHELNVQPSVGRHHLVVVDENGESVGRDFEVQGE